jgi:DNA-repair protein XRCC2
LGLHPGDVLEIQGPAATGKTALLYHLVVDYIIPPSMRHSSHEQIEAAVRHKGVIVFDTDNCFDLAHLRHVLSSRLAKMLSHLASDSIEITSLCQICLEGVHLFFPTTSLQMAIALNHLLKYHAQSMPDRKIGLVAIDSISSFFWPDRFAAEQTRAVSKNKTSLSPGTSLFHIFNQLERIRTSLRSIIVYTNWGLNPVLQSNNTVEFKQHLPYHPSLIHTTSVNQGVREDRHPDTTITLPLTHHITFSTPFLTGISTEDTPQIETNAIAISTCILRYARGSKTKHFSLFVNEDGIVFED